MRGLFRGKRVDNGEWVEGWLGSLHSYDSHEKSIFSVYFTKITKEFDSYPNIIVDYKTVGQYTGSKDKNDTKIFEGDIVYSVRDAELAVIKWDDFTARFIIEFDGIITDFDNYYASDLEVVGNIHDNPELSEAQG